LLLALHKLSAQMRFATLQAQQEEAKRRRVAQAAALSKENLEP